MCLLCIFDHPQRTLDARVKEKGEEPRWAPGGASALSYIYIYMCYITAALFRDHRWYPTYPTVELAQYLPLLHSLPCGPGAGSAAHKMPSDHHFHWSSRVLAMPHLVQWNMLQWMLSPARPAWNTFEGGDLHLVQQRLPFDICQSDSLRSRGAIVFPTWKDLYIINLFRLYQKFAPVQNRSFESKFN